MSKEADLEDNQNVGLGGLLGMVMGLLGHQSLNLFPGVFSQEASWSLPQTASWLHSNSSLKALLHSEL